MSLSAQFNPAPSAKPERRARKKRPAPFSLRLSEDERARLEAEAKGAPLGAYIKAKLMGDAPVRLRRAGLAIQDRKALGRLLAMLGSSRLSANLNQLALAANSGSLPLTPETLAELEAALTEVRQLRALLLDALGLRAEDPK